MTNSYQTDGAGLSRANKSQVLILHPIIRIKGIATRDPENRLEEAEGLALAINLKVIHREAVRVDKIQPATLIGKGVAERFGEFIKSHDIDLVIMDTSLSPVQQRNLEKLWDVKVIDRTGLILEIFGERARTHEGRLQVELAAMNFQRSRLVRSWTHLERQRGGFGFTGGPGESQLEIDRRLIDERISKLKRQLNSVRKTRELQRSARKKIPYPIVALVGYTNAGKSTLFNYLTNSNVMAENLLFATLDPTMRQVKLPSGRKIILSDTVGFISDLPTDLIASFRATLEEVCAADIVIHVRDMASMETEAQKQDVLDVLETLKLPLDIKQINALNKIDLLEDDIKEKFLDINNRCEDEIAISAFNGENCHQLLIMLDKMLSEKNEILDVILKAVDGRLLAWIYENGEILSRSDDKKTGDINLSISLNPKDLGRFNAKLKSIENKSKDNL